MRLLFIIFMFLSFTNNKKIDFGKKKDGRNWQVVNDGVMGGLSEGEAQLTEDSVFFKGNVSLDNNGGFSSLRSSYSKKELSKHKSVEIKYRSKGISMAMTLSVSRRWYIPNYKTSLEGTKGKWKTVTLALEDFRKHYIGKPMEETLREDELKKVIRYGFITDEKKYGNFEFEIDYLEFK